MCAHSQVHNRVFRPYVDGVSAATLAPTRGAGAIAVQGGGCMGDAAVMTPQAGLDERLESHGVDRRTFLKFCSTMAAVLALPPSFAKEIATKLQAVAKP